MLKKEKSWRYQVVYIQNNESFEYSICEVYLDEFDKLEAWTNNFTISPYGDSHQELIGDLQIMLEDVKKWKPVNFNELKVGMTFQKQEQ